MIKRPGEFFFFVLFLFLTRHRTRMYCNVLSVSSMANFRWFLQIEPPPADQSGPVPAKVGRDQTRTLSDPTAFKAETMRSKHSVLVTDMPVCASLARSNKAAVIYYPVNTR